MYDTYEEYEGVERLNKSQQKREISALHELAKKLAALDQPILEGMNLPDPLFKALVSVKSMKRAAEKRQLKFIVKLLRQSDNESLVATISELENRKEDQAKNFHRLERWRDRLIGEGHEAITEFMRRYPHADAGQIRQLVRNANRELTQNKPHRASRALFQLLRETIELKKR